MGKLVALILGLAALALLAAAVVGVVALVWRGLLRMRSVRALGDGVSTTDSRDRE